MNELTESEKLNLLERKVENMEKSIEILIFMTESHFQSVIETLDKVEENVQNRLSPCNRMPLLYDGDTQLQIVLP